MKKCSEYDESTPMRCRSGHAGYFPLCRGVEGRLIPYCMREDPPERLTREDGYPLGWPNVRQTKESS